MPEETGIGPGLGPTFRLPWPGGRKPPDVAQIVPVTADLMCAGHIVATAATGERSHLPAVTERQLRELRPRDQVPPRISSRTPPSCLMRMTETAAAAFIQDSPSRGRIRPAAQRAGSRRDEIDWSRSVLAANGRIANGKGIFSRRMMTGYSVPTENKAHTTVSIRFRMRCSHV